MLRLPGRHRRAPSFAGPAADAEAMARLARQRRMSFLLAAFFLAVAVVVFPQRPAAAATPIAEQRADLCTVTQWQSDFSACVDRLADVAAARAQCLKAPPPDAPDSGLGGWFASRPDAGKEKGQKGYYTEYGYAGYSYTTYDIGCAQTLMHPDYKFENTVANGEFMLATAVVGAANALRERAWEPETMWDWANPLVDTATKAIYSRVFTVFGAITLAVIGLYLLWRSRQAQLSSALTTIGWALFVMVIVTALARWPAFSAQIADKTLVSSLAVVHDAVGPPSQAIPPEQCTRQDKLTCRDIRPPAIRASDMAVETLLYRNWLRGVLGSSDSQTAQKYGQALYDARVLSWAELEDIQRNPNQRDSIINRKSIQWMKVAEQIRNEDPAAYEYLTGVKGMERIGAGLISLVASILFALFDLTASLLVLLGFLLFRWAVVAAPLLGTVGMLRPASAGFRRLMNAVIAAMFNIVIFGSAAAIYLFAVDLIMTTASLPGWLQVVLVGLCGVVGWLLLRPYRRITQLGGGVSAAAALAASSAKRPAGDGQTSAASASGSALTISDRQPQRVELRPDPPIDRPSDRPASDPAPRVPRRRMPPVGGGGWTEPSIEDDQPSYSLYRPSRSPVSRPHDRPSTAGARVEARRES